jgi:uncharacterized protein involved in exopolysaccharide biosynthesis
MVEQAIGILKRRKRLIVIPFIVVFLMPAIYAALFMRSFEANSLVWFDSDASIVPVLSQQAGVAQAADRPIQQEADTLQQLLQSRAFVSAVVKHTSLMTKMGTPREREETISYVRKNMRTEVVGPNALRITFYGKNPQQAVSIAGATTDQFLSTVRETVREQNDKSVAFFAKRSEQYAAELNSARAEIRAYKEKHPSAQQLDVGDKVLTAPKVTASPAVQMQFQRLKSQEEYAKQLYETSLVDLAETRSIASAKEEQYLTGFRVVDKPVLPTSFSKRRMLLADMLAFMVAAAVAVLAVLVAEATDRTVRTEKDVREAVDLPVLVEIKQPPQRAGEA